MKARAYLLRAFQFVFVMHLVGLSVPAQAVNTTHNGITVSWEALPLFDIMPGPSETWENNYYYQSAQFLPEGNWLSVRITLPAEYVQNSTDWGSQITLYNPATGSTLAATDQVWPTGSPAEDLVLQALVPVNVTSNYLWAAFSISVSVGVGDVYSGFSIHFTASPSLRTSLAFNPGKSGGPDDNPWTVFDLSDGPGCAGQQGLPYYSVNTSTLNLVVQDTDYISVGVGPEIATTHTWNTDPSQQGMFGNGWTFPYESTLTSNCFGASLKKGSGQVVHYNARLCDPDPVTFPLSAESPKGVLDTLTLMSGDYWIWKERSTKYQYRYDFLSTNAYGEKTYRLTSLTDKNGNAANFTYNANGRINAITDAGARVVSFTYDANGHCQSMTTPDNKTASYAYDGNGNLTRTVDLLGTEIAYTYDADNYMTSMRVGDKTTTFVYDEVDGWFHVASITDANGKAKTYRSPKYRQHEITDSRGNTTTYISDSAGRSLAITNAVSAFTQWVYNANGLPSSARDANSRTTLMEYDARGNLTKLTDPLGSVTTFTFDADDNMLTRTNALGQTWSYDYDRGNLSKMATPLGLQATMTYDARGRMTSMTNENNQATFFTYDSFGNIQTVKDPLNNTTTYEYDAYGINRTKRTSADGKSTQYEYDNNRRLTKEIYADGTFRTYSYDSCSLVASTDEKGNRTELTRDNLLNVTRTTNPSGESVASGYDGNSNLTSLTDALNHNYVNTYDSENRLTQIKNPAGNSLVKTYDAVSNMTALIDERGKTTSLTYDKNNRHATTVDPLGKTVTNTRDALGRITQITNARGGRIGFAYDADGRMTQKTYNGTAVATYSYDNAGNITSASDATGSTTTYSYNGLNKVDNIQYPDARALSFAYDQVGNVTTITYPGGLVVGYSYDLRNRIQTVTWDSQSISYQYDGAGNPLRIVRPNNTASTCAFDATGRIVEIDHQRNSTSFAKMQYTRDAVGNIVRETSTLPISPSVTSMTMAAHYTDTNQIDTWRNYGYTHDADGNVTQIKDIETDEVSWSAIYDQQNRLTQLTRGAATAAYTYDGAGNRTKAVVGSTVRNYHYDHLGRLMFETDGGGTISVYYIYAGERLVALKKSGSSYFYHFDKTGNTLALTDAAGGIVNGYAYTPFGQGAGSSGTLYNPFTYVGEFGVMSEGGNIYFMKNRYYDAVTGRFIQKDPVGFTGGQSNLYAYVGNNPVETIDPTGTAWWEDIAVGAAAAGGYAAVLVATGTPVGWGVLAVGGAAMTIKKTYELVTTQAPKTAEALDKASQSMANLGRASRSLVRTCEMSDSGTLEEKIEIYYKQRDGQVELYNVGVEAKDAMKDAAGETLKTAIEAGKVASGLKKF